MSELPAGVSARTWGFVQRNRLIAALAAATVVVEAAARSGALWTAAAARGLGRALLAVPGDVDRETARGCHALLRSGALLCEDASDVVRAIDCGAPDRAGASAAGEGGSAESRMLRALSSTPEAIESLARRAGVELGDAVGALLALQWSGIARSAPGQRWSRADS
jgi:DNA processing protein